MYCSMVIQGKSDDWSCDVVLHIMYSVQCTVLELYFKGELNPENHMA